MVQAIFRVSHISSWDMIDPATNTWCLHLFLTSFKSTSPCATGCSAGCTGSVLDAAAAEETMVVAAAISSTSAASSSGSGGRVLLESGPAHKGNSVWLLYNPSLIPTRRIFNNRLRQWGKCARVHIMNPKPSIHGHALLFPLQSPPDKFHQHLLLLRIGVQRLLTVVQAAIPPIPSK